MITLFESVLPPIDIDALVKTPPAVSTPVPAEVSAYMQDLSTTFFKSGMRYTITFGRESELAMMTKAAAPIVPDKEVKIGVGKQTTQPNCGPETLAMALQGYDLQVSANDIEEMSNFTSLGTSPNSLRDVAKQYGFNSVILNNSNFSEVSSILDKGGICIALVESGTALHYVAINGYKRDANGNNRYFIADPSGYRYCVSEAEFGKTWKDVQFRGFDTGFSCGVIAISKDSNLPQERFDGKAFVLSKAHSLINTTIRSAPIIGAISLLSLLKFRRRGEKKAEEKVPVGAKLSPAS